MATRDVIHRHSEKSWRLVPEGDYVLVVALKAADIKMQLAKFGSRTEKKIGDPVFQEKCLWTLEPEVRNF